MLAMWFEECKNSDDTDKERTILCLFMVAVKYDR